PAGPSSPRHPRDDRSLCSRGDSQRRRVMNRIPRPSPAMVVAVTSLVVAIGGTATALPGRATVDRNDLRKSVVGARAIGKVMLEHRAGMLSTDPLAGDGQFTEVEGEIRCPSKAPFAFDPSIGI